MKLNENDQIIFDRFNKFLYEKEYDNELLVQIIALAGSYLNLMSISDYSKQNKMTYNGVKYNRNIVELFNQKFVIDNV